MRHILDEQTRKMINKIRLISENKDVNEKEKENEFIITKRTPHFGDIRETQEEALIKTIGESVELEDEALVYKPDIKDLVLTGKITSLGMIFQFRYNDPSGEGCYLWVKELQLTESNQKTIGKVRDAFLNWKASLLQNGDLLEKLHKAATEK